MLTRVVIVWLAAASIGYGADIPADASSDGPAGTIAFASLAARGWDLYSLDEAGTESRLTQHRALDYNAAFSPDGGKIAFVSERDGNMELYVADRDGSSATRLTTNYAMDDHPTFSPDGSRIAFVSTRVPAPAGRAWNAIYVMNTDGSDVTRVSQSDAADYSPAWSPRGDLIAFASGSGKSGESDLYVMAPDGSGRRMVIEDAGWPTFIEDGQAIAFHRSRDKGGWDIWRVMIDGSGLARLMENASMPRATPDGSKLAFVARRGSHQQIGVLDVAQGPVKIVTDGETDHWNPTISANGERIVYHKESPDQTVPNVELWGTPTGTELNLLRLAGAFPAYSPDGKRLALTGGSFARIDVMDLDGQNRKTIFEGKRRTLFGTSWSHGVERVAFSYGVVFGDSGASVNIMAASPDDDQVEPLTADAGNNGFPSYSPDGSQLVFRSGRDGPKNLYIADRDGSNVRRLTEGDWTDTMCDWSPKGDWIAFSSTRDDDYEVWMIRPDGSGLKKLIGGGGRHNHPHFSPDAKWIVFTSQRAGYSAEEVSLPNQPQQYGDLFVIRTDGSDLIRLTHNGFEEGTPAWSSVRELIPSGEGSTTEDDY